MSTLAHKEPQALWRNEIKETEDSFNSKDQLLMLDELREAIESLAQQISQQNSGAEVNTDNLVAKPDDASSEKTPSIGFETASTQDEEEYEQEVMRLVEEIASANSIEDLEQLHGRFSLRAEALKGKLASAKSQKLLEAYLSLMATLQVLNKQIDHLKQNPQLQVNFRLMAENIMQSLIRNQTAIRLAAERTMNQTLTSTLQNQLTAMRDALQKQLALQQQQQTSGVQDALIKNLQNMLKAMETALKAMEAQRNGTLTAEQAKRAQDAMRAINENLIKLIQQLQQRLQAQLKVATDVNIRNSIQQQLNTLQSTLNAARIAELNSRLSNVISQFQPLADAARIAEFNSRPQQSNAYDSGLQMARNPAQQNAYAYDPNKLSLNNIASAESRLAADAATKGATYPLNEVAQRSVTEAMRTADVARTAEVVRDAAARMEGTERPNEINKVAEQQRKTEVEKTATNKTPEEKKPEDKKPEEKDPKQFDRENIDHTISKLPTAKITTPCGDCVGGTCCSKGGLNSNQKADLESRIESLKNDPSSKPNITSDELKQLGEQNAKDKMQKVISSEEASRIASKVEETPTAPAPKDAMLDSLFADTLVTNGTEITKEQGRSQ